MIRGLKRKMRNTHTPGLIPVLQIASLDARVAALERAFLRNAQAKVKAIKKSGSVVGKWE
jgi:hypothetical protein